MNKRVNLDGPELAGNLRSSEPRSEGIVQRRQPRRSFMSEEQQTHRRSSLDVALDEIEPVPEDLQEEPEVEVQPETTEDSAPVAAPNTEVQEAVVQPNFKYGVVPNTKLGWTIVAMVFAFVAIISSLVIINNPQQNIAPVLSAVDLNEDFSVDPNLKMPVDSPVVTASNALEYEVPQTLSDYNSFKVANFEPRLLQIEKLGVVAIVESIGTSDSDNLVLPDNTYNAGWYENSRKINDNKGAILISGHASGYESEGIFKDLATLVDGDKIMLEGGNGFKYQFEVIERLFHEYGEEDMRNAQLPRTSEELSLNLLNCDCRSDLPDDEKQRSVLIRAIPVNSSTN